MLQCQGPAAESLGRRSPERTAQMAAIKPTMKEGVEAEEAPLHRIRITLTSKNVKNLEKGERESGLRLGHSRFPPLLCTAQCLQGHSGMLAPFGPVSRGRAEGVQRGAPAPEESAPQEVPQRCRILTRCMCFPSPRSVRRPDQGRQGQAAQGEGPRPHAHQDPAHHHPQGPLR